MKTIKLVVKFSLFILFLITPALCRAMPPGTLLYRTSGNGKMYGYSLDPLIYSEKGIVKNIYAGHVAIYIGREDGEDYIVEAAASGIVKTPAKYFVNLAEEEKFLGAKIPSGATELQRAKVVAIAKSLVGKSLAYDLDFKNQKGPRSGDWTCVGLAEKLYESANIPNPNNLAALEYDQKYYAVDITPDGFDSCLEPDAAGDCFSQTQEFSKIAPRKNLLIPAPELVGFDLGLERNGNRYIFLPYTQFLQSTLSDVSVDAEMTSSFSGVDIRGPLNTKALALRWSLINNPISSLKIITAAILDSTRKIVDKTKELAQSLSQKIFGSDSGTAIVLADQKLKKTAATTKKTSVAQKVTATKSAIQKIAATVFPKITVNKARAVKKMEIVATPVKDTSAPAVNNKITSLKKSTPTTTTIAATIKTPIATKSATTTAPVSPAYYPTVVYNTVSNPINPANNQSEADRWPKLARIEKIYATGNNDWVELYNPTEHDFDLAAAGYRLEKAKTTVDPSLIMRLGNSEDGDYPGGTVIKAHDYYLIVRDEADNYYLSRADAIATRDEFNWSDSGYTLYLGVGTLSSNTDSDIVDAVGFGSDATYFQGSAPAPEIIDNYFLNRLANRENNFSDFNLVPAVDPAAIIARATFSTSTNATSTEETVNQGAATSTEEVINEETATSSDETLTPIDETASSTKLALISKIYSTGDNDWVELYNPTEVDFDLALTNYRLEKTKTAADPYLIMRLGNLEDGSYPGGTIIKSHGKYLIVRDQANIYYKNQADAIGIRDEFGWTGSGYTLYLGNGTISSSTDSNIRDFVGFGSDATYFQGSGPALEITDNYILNRFSFNNDNRTDFNLIPTDDPTAINEEIVSGNLDLFVPPVPIISNGLANLWHFDECSGAGRWAVGKWNCAKEIGAIYDKIITPLNPVVDLNSFSLSFYYRKSYNYPRVYLAMSNPENNNLQLILEPGQITIEGLPNSDWRYYGNIPFDENWHQVTLVVNQAADYWAVYIDGQEIIKEIFMTRLPIMTDLILGGDCDPILVDELAIWDRPLDSNEILTDYLSKRPYSPVLERTSQIAARLLHFWDFEEDSGIIAADSIGQAVLNVESVAWTARSHNNYAINTLLGRDFTAEIENPLISRDLSLAFWWRDSSYPNNGRANIFLTSADNDSNPFIFSTNNFRLSYWFNGVYGILTEGINNPIPSDDLWHHLALVYDSYRYKLRFYVDGEEKASSSLIWLKEGEEINYLKISSDNSSAAIDDLGIYEGALSPAQVKKIYTDTK